LYHVYLYQNSKETCSNTTHDETVGSEDFQTPQFLEKLGIKVTLD